MTKEYGLWWIDDVTEERHEEWFSTEKERDQFTEREVFVYENFGPVSGFMERDS